MYTPNVPILRDEVRHPLLAGLGTTFHIFKMAFEEDLRQCFESYLRIYIILINILDLRQFRSVFCIVAGNHLFFWSIPSSLEMQDMAKNFNTISTTKIANVTQ